MLHVQHNGILSKIAYRRMLYFIFKCISDHTFTEKQYIAFSPLWLVCTVTKPCTKTTLKQISHECAAPYFLSLVRLLLENDKKFSIFTTVVGMYYLQVVY